MFRAFFLACLFIVLPALADEPANAPGQKVLVAQPPTYANEGARGAFLTNDGDAQPLFQAACKSDKNLTADFDLKKLDQAACKSGSKTFLIEFLAIGDMVPFVTVFNEYTGLGSYVIPGSEKGAVVDTTCPPDKIYPITLGKVVECTVKTKTDKGVILSKVRHAFDTEEVDASGHRTGFCETEEERENDRKTTLRICYTPDGKWKQKVQILSATFSPPT